MSAPKSICSRKKFNGPKTFFKRALETDSTLARAELGLAKIAKMEGNADAYREHLAKARKLDPAAGNDLQKGYARLKQPRDSAEAMPQ